MKRRFTPQIVLALAEFELTYVRSTGPGGQNVNKVNSKAVLRWNIAASPALSWALKTRILQRLEGRLTRDGDLLITSDRFRDQAKNREDCFDKLGELLTAAAFVATPRKKTQPSYSSTKRAESAKKRQAQKKKLRRGAYDD